MDAIILAAGRNERLKHVIPEYTKTSVQVKGVPLLVRTIKQLFRVYDVDKVIVVVAPENGLRIREELTAYHLLSNSLRFVMQPFPAGPGDALMRGLEASTTRSVLALCGDNIFTDGALENFTAAQEPFVVGVRTIPMGSGYDIRRFTRITQDYTFEEGEAVSFPWDDGCYRVWLGPLKLPAAAMRDALYMARQAGREVSIGIHLQQLGQPTCVEVQCEDIGTLDAYKKLTDMRI